MSVRFYGETHGCYSDALQMALGPAGPGESVLEVLTGSPFGLKVYSDGRPFFAPAHWTPEIGMDAALSALGWEWDQVGGNRAAAIEEMRRASTTGPLLAGPVEMGLLPHQPGLGKAIGTDHYLTILGLEDDMVLLHDPRGHPFTLVPMEPLFTAWQTETLSFPVEPYNLRANFRRVRDVDPGAALRQMLPTAAKYLAETDSAAAAEKVADLLEKGLNTAQYFHFAAFMVCVGARRRADAGLLLGGLGYLEVAATLDHQARLIGSVQYPIVSGDPAAAAPAMRKLAPTFEQLRQEILAAIEAG